MGGWVGGTRGSGGQEEVGGAMRRRENRENANKWVRVGFTGFCWVFPRIYLVLLGFPLFEWVAEVFNRV